jgi:hypothetical protein
MSLLILAYLFRRFNWGLKLEAAFPQSRITQMARRMGLY